MRESDLLQHIFERSRDLSGSYPDVVVGPGDDCAVLRVGASTAFNLDGELLLITVDQLVEGRHFRAGTPVDRIARKIVARSVSDIAAMGGYPSWGLATAALPEDYTRADQLFDAMSKWGRHFGCPLVGGDIASLGIPGQEGRERYVAEGKHLGSPAQMVLTCTVAGKPHPRRGPVLRSTAREGDEVWVTGRLGGSLGSGRHLTFEPRIREGLWLCETLGEQLHAMIDLSDGLGRDAGRIAEASGVRIELHGPQLPVHENVASWEEAIGDGEDYELCFAVAPGSLAGREEACPHTGTTLSCVGRVRAGTGCVLVDDEGKTVDVSEMGWDHGGSGE